MLFVSSSQLLESLPPQVDGVELRLDLCSSTKLSSLPSFPVLLTVRKASQGGQFVGSEEEREALIEQLLRLRPAFFDLEWDMRESFLRKTLTSYPNTRFILSYHNFQETPTDLETLYQAMRRYPAYTYKIAALSRSTNDALRLLLFSKKTPLVSAICMGEKGSFARILGPIVGNRVNYTHCGAPTASGQLSLEEWISVYNYPKLTPQTALYGLIGDPVNHSQGHFYHNRVLRNAVYVKMSVTADELPDFFPLAKAIGFRGLSVTMPLKEKVLPFLDCVDTSIGAINTIRFEQGQLFGTNTDGIGALDAIEKRLAVRGQRLVVAGAGGTGRAIAFEAKRRGAEVWVMNRTLQKAQELSAAVGGFVGLPSHYDILINCSPEPVPIEPLPNALVMDVVYVPKETPFLQKAKSLGCEVIYGDEMFFNQAAAQVRFWDG